MDFKTFIETENSFCIPRLALIASCYKLLTAKLHLRYVKESGAGVGNFVKVGNFRKIQVGVDVGVGHFTSDATSLVLTVSRFVLQYMVKMHPFQNCESRCSKFNAYEKSTAAVFNSFWNPHPVRKEIIFAPLAPFDVLLFVSSQRFAQRSLDPKKSLFAPPGGASIPSWEPLVYKNTENVVTWAPFSRLYWNRGIIALTHDFKKWSVYRITQATLLHRWNKQGINHKF